MFARTLAPMLLPQDLVWVHDYHLIPLAEELRKLDRTEPIGFFLHTPFPAAELLRVLPNHQSLMRSLCAYDLVGFQTQSDLDGFRDYLLRWAGGEELGHGVLRAFGRVVRAQVFPIGIDVATVSAQAEAADGSRHMRRLRQSVGDRALMIGVDRLDYSKGLEARFQAYSHFIETYRETRGRTVLMQISPPSRSEVPEYRDIRRNLAAAAGQINSRYGEFDWTPLRYINKSFSHPILTGFFRASRIGLVTPLRDGMNLVAKEYVASQSADDPGVLILSCFAGAARELGEAVIVNPFDVEEMAEAILQGLDMPLGERKERWTAMMKVLERNDITAWRERFVRALTATATGMVNSAPGAPETWLVGDIGATHARFGLVSPDGKLLHSRTFADEDYPTIDDALSAFLAERGDIGDAAAGGDRDRLGDHRRSRCDDEPPLELLGPGIEGPVCLRAVRGDQRFHRAGAGPPAPRPGGPAGGWRRRCGRRRAAWRARPGIRARRFRTGAVREGLDRADRRRRACDDGAGHRSRGRRPRSYARTLRSRLGRAGLVRPRARQPLQYSRRHRRHTRERLHGGPDHRFGDPRRGPAVRRDDDNVLRDARDDGGQSRR